MCSKQRSIWHLDCHAIDFLIAMSLDAQDFLTDPRTCAQNLGQVLVQEAMSVAYDQLNRSSLGAPGS